MEKYIIGNWKMNLGIRESTALARGVLRFLRGNDHLPKVVLCPAFTALSEVNKVLSRSRVSLGAQNAGEERFGAYTGDISIPMLEDIGVSHVILGHSERFSAGETNEMVQKKFLLAWESKIQPILCIGNEQKNKKGLSDGLKDQLKARLPKHLKRKRKKLIIAYEPLWAIGSGESLPVEDMIRLSEELKRFLEQEYHIPQKDICICYGGSITGDNAYQFLREQMIDGILVGGASIKIRQFEQILQAGLDVQLAQNE